MLKISTFSKQAQILCALGDTTQPHGSIFSNISMPYSLYYHIRFMTPQYLFNVARTIVCMHFCCTFQMCTGSKDIIISKIFPNVNKVSYRAKYYVAYTIHWTPKVHCRVGFLSYEITLFKYISSRCVKVSSILHSSIHWNDKESLPPSKTFSKNTNLIQFKCKGKYSMWLHLIKAMRLMCPESLMSLTYLTYLQTI